MEEVQRHDRVMQQMRNDWRNEQQAQLQLQQDEEEQEHQRFDQHRELMHRQQRLEEAANNVSRQNIAGYQLIGLKCTSPCTSQTQGQTDVLSCC